MKKTLKISRRKRRYNNKVIKKSFYWILKDEWFLSQSKKEKEKIIGKLLNTRTQCSCNMCCNSRKSKLIKGKNRYSIQEIKSNEEFKYD